MRASDKLTDIAVRSAKAKEKPYKLADGKGLYLEVSPNGSKWWRLKYRFDGKEKKLALGVYPEVPLASRKDKKSGTWIEGARDKRDRARQLLADGIDPAAARKSEKTSRALLAANSFEAIAREWHTSRLSSWTAGHAERILRRLESDIFPHIGAHAISNVTPPDLLAALRRVENRGALETAHRELQTCGQVY